MWQGSWVWEEHFLDYFVDKGFECYCLNLRGHNGSPAKGWFRFTPLGAYVEDLSTLIDSLETPPIVFGHSMGGYITQKYLQHNDLPLAILLAAIPPSGVVRPTFKVMFKMPFSFLRSNLTLNLRYIINSVKKSRQMFFGAEMTDAEISDYVEKMNNESYLAYLAMLFGRVRTDEITSPVKVIGGGDDFAITKKLIEETAEAYNTTPKFFPGRPHNLMLGEDWEEVAEYCYSLIAGEFDL